MAADVEDLKAELILAEILAQVVQIVAEVKQMAADVAAIKALITAPPVVGVQVQPGKPTTH